MHPFWDKWDIPGLESVVVLSVFWPAAPPKENDAPPVEGAGALAPKDGGAADAGGAPKLGTADGFVSPPVVPNEKPLGAGALVLVLLFPKLKPPVLFPLGAGAAPPGLLVPN